MSNFDALARAIVDGPRSCCSTKASEPHANDCRHSPAGMVVRFHQQLVDSLHQCLADGTLSTDDTVVQAIVKLKK